MNQKKIKIQKLVLQFSLVYYKIKENNRLFIEYKDYCENVMKEYENKFNDNNKNLHFMKNFHCVFEQNNILEPYGFLTCGLDYLDNVLVNFFEDLII
jgi:hypothetical protein